MKAAIGARQTDSPRGASIEGDDKPENITVAENIYLRAIEYRQYRKAVGFGAGP